MPSRPSPVLEIPPLPPAEAAAHLRAQLAMTTDPADVQADLAAGGCPFVLVDARSAANYALGHVPGAISFPHRTITAESAARRIPAGRPVVTYCDGVHCNASTKAAAKLAALGHPVKEMLDGLEGWRRDGFPVEVGAGPGES
jgi:rhodanese-related sulfurtransferase